MRALIDGIGQERRVLAEESVALVVDVLVQVAVDDQCHAHGPGELVQPGVAVRRSAQTLMGHQDVGTLVCQTRDFFGKDRRAVAQFDPAAPAINGRRAATKRLCGRKFSLDRWDCRIPNRFAKNAAQTGDLEASDSHDAAVQVAIGEFAAP